MLLLSGVILAAVASLAGLWLAKSDGKKPGVSSPEDSSAGTAWDVSKPRKSDGRGVKASGEEVASGSHPFPQSIAGTNRQPQQFRAKPGEPAKVLGILASSKQTVNERVRQLQAMRGISFSKDERESALAFLAGQQVPEGMGKGSMQWLADELLTALRLQQPPREGLAAELAKVAFQPGTDPVVRDYIMQHLGHLWEQDGARKEIDAAPWRAVETADETTPGTALIALSRGYARDQDKKSQAAVDERALALAADPKGILAVRVTALSIAGDGGGAEVKELADRLTKDATTPVILREVAERVGR